jgi:anaerobic magnesium-protoporphyrin IX monomethyl ester cyclase
MADILIAHSNHLFNDRKQVEKMQPYPPLQPLLAAAILREAGFQVVFCDVMFDNPEAKFRDMLALHEPRLVIVCEDGFNFLSKMCLSRNRDLAFWMATTARHTGATVAAHSADASDHTAAYLDAGFDYVLIGEVEETVLELAQGRPVNEIAGLAYIEREKQTVCYTMPRSLRTNLDALPRPAWDLIDMEPYRSAWMAAHGYFSLNMVSSRGCPFHCNWCAKPVYGNRYHVRSAWLVAEEMLALKRTYQPQHIWFADDIFALSGAWAQEFELAVTTLDARIPFKMQSRCDLMIRDTVTALKNSGCVEVWMGAESGSQRILDAMDKGIRVEQVYRARKNLAEHGIRACFFLQFGYPGEQWEEINATVQMVRETKPDDIGVSVSYPLPGTKFFNLVSAQMGKKSNWNESGELAMMFQGAFSTEFYRALADALRLEVRHGYDTGSVSDAWKKVHALEGNFAAAAGAGR